MTDNALKTIKDELAKIDEARAKATQGEWSSELTGTVISTSQQIEHLWNHGTKSYTDVVCKSHIEHNVSKDDIKNMEFIALAANEITKLTKALSVAVTTLESYKDAAFDIDGKIYKVGSKAELSLTTIANILSGGKTRREDGK